MSSKKTETADPNQQAEFILKHRITGAAFLLFFGALLLPWLLGPPSVASKLGNANNGYSEEQSTLSPSLSGSAEGGSVSAVSADDLNTSSNLPNNESNRTTSEEDLLSAIAGEQIAASQQVYISKITPRDSSEAASANALGKDQSVTDPATKNVTKEQSDKARKQAEADASKPIVSPKASKLVTAGLAKPKVASGSTGRKTNTANINPKPSASNGGSTSTNLSSSLDNTAASSPVPAIDVGWAVQVGVFTDKLGAANVVADLRTKGFQPSTTIVDTNRGPATGTRIWLGPYAQRVEAAKAKTQLTQKTGEAGFIRAYP